MGVYTIRTSSCESTTRYYSTSIILSVDYKPLQFTPPIFANIDAHKEGVTPTVFRTSETTLKNLVIRLTLGHKDLNQ